jgi:hypothetical protein
MWRITDERDFLPVDRRPELVVPVGYRYLS